MMIILTACTKDSINENDGANADFAKNELAFKSKITSTYSYPILDDYQHDLLEKISKEVLSLVKQPNFESRNFTENLKTRSEDYDVELSSLKSKLQSPSDFSESLATITELSKEFEHLSDGIKLKLYYPSAKIFDKNSNLKSKDKEPEIVIMNNYNEDYSSPSFVLDNNEELVYSQDVTEEYANKNNVIVIGSEALRSNIVFTTPDDPHADGGSGDGSGATPLDYNRTDGRPEFGGKIQVTDMNKIEHWTAGKFEFRVVVISAAGTIVKDKEFPQRARDNFKDQKWYNYNEFYFNWNQSNIGAFNIEKWIEIDSGGSKTETTITVPPAFEGAPTLSVKVTLEDNDEDLGQTIVQFSDHIGQAYGISHLNFKRQ